MLLHVHVVMLIHWYERKKNFFSDHPLFICLVLAVFVLCFWLGFVKYCKNDCLTEVGAYQVHLNAERDGRTPRKPKVKKLKSENVIYT